VITHDALTLAASRDGSGDKVLGERGLAPVPFLKPTEVYNIQVIEFFGKAQNVAYRTPSTTYRQKHHYPKQG
jgi:hypothetical protein